MHFEPGQFGWLMLEQSPFSMSQHPFSFSSSAEQRTRLSITIKERGDFTSLVGKTPKGARAYVDGPHGLFSTDRHEGFGFFLIGGGVGITPLMSILRTMADRGDVRPCVLMYGSKDRDAITFRDELDALATKLNLTLVHALEDPPDGWEGERGFIDAAMLRRHLPAQMARFRCFICGPTPMMDAMEAALVEVGVPVPHIHSERFDMV
jgi:predicted ferric reductase